MKLDVTPENRNLETMRVSRIGMNNIGKFSHSARSNGGYLTSRIWIARKKQRFREHESDQRQHVACMTRNGDPGYCLIKPADPGHHSVIVAHHLEPVPASQTLSTPANLCILERSTFVEP